MNPHPPRIDVSRSPRTGRAVSRTRAGQAGFTLIELMVAMVVSAIVVLGIFAFSTIQQSTNALHERNVRVQQALEGAMWTIASDVRQAGLGFARTCTELRVYDASSGRLINPGATANPAASYLDNITDEPYWVLRDGVQAHWASAGAGTINGTLDSSASPDAASDSFDVILADADYLGSYGVFVLDSEVAAGEGFVRVRTSNLLNNGEPDHLAQVQQLFPPGSFIAVGRMPGATANPFSPENHGQCMLLQITGDVALDPADTNIWRLPIDGVVSGFNAGVATMVDDSNGDPDCPAENAACDDWAPGTLDNIADGASVLPLGRLRWSRYEIDYTNPALPYLVRYDIIGYQPDVDPGTLGGVDYPHCAAGTCPAPQLHLPGGESPPTAVAIGPMIEDMQVAVGCDGYTVAGAADPLDEIPPPDAGYEEVGPAAGPVLGPNGMIDENDPNTGRDSDEWLGNARTEVFAPDCVYYGTAEFYRDGWVAVEGTDNPPPAFRMSPQSLRVTLVASSEFQEEAGGLTTDQILAVEDRAAMDSPVGVRQRFTMTERFAPKNLRWRDPLAQ